MAQKFGGKFSPQGSDAPQAAPQTNAFSGRTARQVSASARFLFFLPTPLLIAGIGEIRQADPMGMLLELGGYVALMLSAWLVNEGLRAEEAYNARAVASPPLPRKIPAALVTGAAIGTLSAAEGGLFSGLVFGGVAVAAQLAAFGIDPLSKKGLEGSSDFESSRVATAVEKAENLLSELEAAAATLRDRALEHRVETMAQAARNMFRLVEQDPRDLPRARKFMGVYLTGARDATRKYAELSRQRQDAEARASYLALITDLETSFQAQQEHLLLDDRTDLDVEIEVLRKRLETEGLKRP